ncbi:transcriptional regulator [Streptomyces alkaliphilus]|uniref:transcriptional regulator n=1 Tax=Streptomyces alkaliphilus TaxID=1472722 RepID=UPI00117E3DD3|nr:transcriptional regulator [Streptomyces alkaliphilus]MQS07888.1 transcriptional regulator [Streptomyces alkaliphilus]
MIEGPGVPPARQPNERLVAMIREAGCSNAGLARRVNVRAAERGLDFRYDKTSVARWIRGQQPRGRAPEVIAEALGAKLGRPVTPEEIGMGGARRTASSIGLRFAPDLGDSVEQAAELWRTDGGRRDPAGFDGSRLPAAAGATPSALVEPSRDWLITPVDDRVGRTGGPRVGTADVEAVRATSAALVELDRRWGSGHVRPLVVHYLGTVVAGLLSGSYREEVGRELFAVAARLTELAGYMAVDTGLPGLAQRYYIQALRLSQAAGDRGFGGYVLAAGMSHLAAQLGNPREVVQLARAAGEGTRGRVGPRAEALYLAAEARGHAQLGDRESCRRAASAAVAALERADPASGDDPDWITHFDRAYLADELAHCHRDLGQGGATRERAREALAELPEGRTRRRVIVLLLLASGRLQEGELEEACRTAGEAGELLEGVRSRRGTEYFGDFLARLAPHQGHPSVTEFTERWRGAGSLPVAV